MKKMTFGQRFRMLRNELGLNQDRWNECSNGIHFFMTRREAELY